jgi:hypothetical protein
MQRIVFAVLTMLAANAEARGGGGGVFGLDILGGVLILIGLCTLVKLVGLDSIKYIAGFLIAAAVFLHVVSFLFNAVF